MGKGYAGFMAAKRATITIVKGQTVRRSLRTPWDLTGYGITCQLRDKNGEGIVKGTFATTLQTNPATGLMGQVALTLTAAATETLTPGHDDLAFDVRLVSPSGEVTYTPRIWLNLLSRVTA